MRCTLGFHVALYFSFISLFKLQASKKAVVRGHLLHTIPVRLSFVFPSLRIIRISFVRQRLLKSTSDTTLKNIIAWKLPVCKYFTAESHVRLEHIARPIS